VQRNGFGSLLYSPVHIGRNAIGCIGTGVDKYRQQRCKIIAMLLGHLFDAPLIAVVAIEIHIVMSGNGMIRP